MDKDEYQYYKELCVCPRCKNKAAPGRVLCEQCSKSIKQINLTRTGFRELNNKSKAKCREARRAAGLCIDCGEPVSADHTRCDECLYFKRVTEKIKYMRKKRGTWDGLYSKTVIDKMAKMIVAEFLRQGWFDNFTPEYKDKR